MTALYNEIEPFAVDWLRNLVAAGHVAQGTVDDRSIADLSPADVAGPGQRHFFAGIGGWSLALRLAGVPDDVSVWTGSCPCQPFSNAGRGKGTSDVRHLWPEWFRLITECSPPIIFGEQVAGAAGRDWLSTVRADLEHAGYAVGAADLAAAGVGAPHIRQRLYFGAVRLADQYSAGFGVERVGHVLDGERAALGDHAHGRGPAERMADRIGDRRQDGLADRAAPRAAWRGGGLGDAGGNRAWKHAGELPRDEVEHGQRSEVGDHASVSASSTRGAWSDAEYIRCTDGKARPAQPGSFPLAHGVPGRVGKLRAYGNAIVPQVAAAFVRALMDVAR